LVYANHKSLDTAPRPSDGIDYHDATGRRIYIDCRSRALNAGRRGSVSIWCYRQRAL